jgi:hypothetical protein
MEEQAFESWEVANMSGYCGRFRARTYLFMDFQLHSQSSESGQRNNIKAGSPQEAGLPFVIYLFNEAFSSSNCRTINE